MDAIGVICVTFIVCTAIVYRILYNVNDMTPEKIKGQRFGLTAASLFIAAIPGFFIGFLIAAGLGMIR